MNISYLGTCSGTEPFENMHHTSLVLTANGRNYWFDAGENSAHRAYTSGINVLKTSAIFISHPHIDHIDGLPHLLFSIDKVSRVKSIDVGRISIFCSDKEVIEAAQYMCLKDSGDFRFSLEIKPLYDGIIFEDENVRVSALHNRHIKYDSVSKAKSYSFLVECEGKRIIYSGDVASPSELDELVSGGCDLLIMETGHHKVADVCEYCVSKGIKAMRLTHHGREIIYGREVCEAKVSEYNESLGTDIKICFDGMSEAL